MTHFCGFFEKDVKTEAFVTEGNGVEVKTGRPLLELAERCENARFPCPDETAAAELVAIKSGICHLMFGRGYDTYSPDFTNSLDAALKLVPHGLAMGFKVAPCQRAHAMLATIGEEWSGSGSTPALALCAAALRARAASPSQGTP